MNSKNNNSIEFKIENIEDSLNKTVCVLIENNLKLKGIVRKYFRLPASNPDEIKVQINDQQYDIIDILSDGIGIYLPLPGIFSVGEVLNSIKFTVREEIFKLYGEVVHISSYEHGNYRCGIKFIDQEEESERSISEYIRINRVKMFSRK